MNKEEKIESKEQVEEGEQKTEKIKSVNEKLGDRMKSYEKKDEKSLDPNLPFIVRVDGHAFSKFTKGLVN